ncbi:Cytochrome c [Planctomycetes bacterium Pan216]|uniref:Cytochrome c n=1 Tax=Kolteria novifilia TaxID=2527975 RepID=A0A518B252_9BACT|nr:Cytochrome c [Planctomycetes bacterium Pan216]
MKQLLAITVATLATFVVHGSGAQAAEPKKEARTTPAEELKLPEGFKAEVVYNVPRDQQGSWVALTVDDQGRIIAADQGDKGLYLITPSKPGEGEKGTTVEKIPVDISNAHGLLWAFDSLYVMRNGKGSGLWRVTDSDGDGKLDKSELIMPLQGAGEHGPHAIILSEDGKSLLVCAGNHTEVPADLTKTRVPTNWGEDLLLPRQPDARGHARGRMAPGGWVAKVSPDGKERELISTGYRNEYDIALDRDGEIFTFDSDMEWDFGLPWYRPTRINHVVSGSEFGWRNGSGKFPEYYADSLPSVVDIGPASPTGVLFGYGAKFPKRWEDAFYILDWTYGTIWAAHLKPEGASYTGNVEQFVVGKPLPVTDGVVGKDGALYFAVGGRGTQSGLYRITYDGKDDGTESFTSIKENPDHQLRKKLEAFHGQEDPAALESAWQHLNHSDRFIRHAARMAIEAQPAESWQRKVLDKASSANPQQLITAMVALARQGDPSLQAELLGKLGELDLASLPKPQLVEALRAYALCFIRMGEPSGELRQQVIAKLDPLYPNSDSTANKELGRVLIYLQAPSAPAKTLEVIKNLPPQPKPQWLTSLALNDQYGERAQSMLDNMPPTDGVYYAFILRNAKEGWTLPLRKEYFQYLVKASKMPGGHSFAGYLENMREEALRSMPQNQRVALGELITVDLFPKPDFEVTPPKGPGREWTVASAIDAVKKVGLKKRNFKKGRNLFHALKCVDCHRFDGTGGMVGPDLTPVSGKFSLKDMLEAIIEPSKVISDQFASSIVLTVDGETFTGVVVDIEPSNPEAELLIYTSDVSKPPIKVAKGDVELMKRSPTSQMPKDVANQLSDKELADLVAYLLSGGNERSPMFRK